MIYDSTLAYWKKRVLELEGKGVEQALDEFNEVVMAPHEETVAKYMAENGRLRLENEKLRKEVRSIRAKLGKTTQAKTPTARKEPAKHGKGSVMVTCQVCGKGFFAKSKSAKYCKACRKEKNREYQRKWQAKRSK